MITVEYYGPLRRLIGLQEERLSVSKVTELLEELRRRYGYEACQEAARSFILINGNNIALLDGLKTSLQQGDTVKIIPLAGGG